MPALLRVCHAIATCNHRERKGKRGGGEEKRRGVKIDAERERDGG